MKKVYSELFPEANKSTLKNLQRKSTFVDEVQYHNDMPLFSWIDINPTELCNRKCVFCPRSDPAFYPNQNVHMSEKLAEKIGKELEQLKYRGAVVLCGYGEPMLHPNLNELIKLFGIYSRVEIITSGDFLTSKKIEQLLADGLDFFAVSMYDGPEQIEHYTNMFKAVGCREGEHYILRDRWYTEDDNFGLKLTNRAGAVNIGDQPEVDVTHPCHYPSYSMTIDWNGDVLLCAHDWYKKVKFGNVHDQTLTEIWNSTIMSKMRGKLACGKRDSAPCNMCNVNGTLHGHNHVDAWKSV